MNNMNNTQAEAIAALMNMPEAFWPSVTQKDPQGVERLYDLPSRALSQRTVYLLGQVTDELCASVVLQLMHLANPATPDFKKDINMYICSPGGSVAAGLKVYDTIRMLERQGIMVNTYAMGYVASMGSFLSSVGSGTRYILPNTQHMIHQPLAASKGQEHEMRIAYEGIIDCRMRLTYGYVKHCHAKSDYASESVEDFFNRLWHETERDNWLDANASKALGLCDEILMPEEQLIVPDSILNDPRYPRVINPPRYTK